MQTHYTFNFGPAPTLRANAPLLAAAPFSSHPISDAEVLLRSRATGAVALVGAPVLQAMRMCADFQPLEQHVRKITASLPGLQGQESGVRAVLDNLHQRGLLVEAQAWLGSLKREVSPAPAPLRTVIIRTAERAQCVQSLLDSLRDYEQRWRPGRRYILVDQSHKAATVALNARLLGEFSATTGCRVLHFDRRQMKRRLVKLQQALPAYAESLGYLLDPERHATGYHGAYGVGLNWTSLLTCSERSLLLDDDFLFPLRLHPQWKPGLSFREAAEPQSLYPSVELALGQGVDCERDPLDYHEASCGHQLGALLANPMFSVTAADLVGVAPAVVGERPSAARVMTSSHGHRGDTCAMGINWLLMQPPETTRQMLASLDFYCAQVARPALWDGSSRFALTKQRGVTPSVLDGSHLLPPVPPMGRGEDVVFSALLETMYPRDLQLELPLAIGHRRPGVPDRSHAFQRAVTPAFGLLVGTQIRGWAAANTGAESAHRLRTLAAHLEELGSLSDHDAVECMQAQLLDLRAQQAASLRTALAQMPDAPAHWQSDVRSSIEANVAAISAPATPRYAEWPEEVDDAQAAARFRGFIRPFGTAAGAWPEAWAWARQHAPRWMEAG